MSLRVSIVTCGAMSLDAPYEITNFRFDTLDGPVILDHEGHPGSLRLARARDVP